MCNYLALLGWSLGDGDREEFDLQEMAAAFTLDRVNTSPARFDPKKLDQINGTWIRRLDPADLADRVAPFLVDAGLLNDPPSPTDLQTLAAAVPLVQVRMVTLKDAVEMLGFLFSAGVTIDPDAAAAVRGPESEAVLKAGIDALEALPGFAAADIEAALRTALVEGLGLKPKNAFGALRVAITGRRVSPPLFESMELLGREASLERLRAGLAALS
jgi:glutamyl-tRNA synthetase